MQQIKPVKCQRGFRRQHLSLAIAVSALLHAGAVAWWFSRPVYMPGPQGVQTVTVELIAPPTSTPEAAASVEQFAPPAQVQPEVLPDDETALKHIVIRKPPEKKPSPKKPVSPIEQTSAAIPSSATVLSSPATPSSAVIPAPAPVTAARYDAAYLRNPAPAYPSLSRRIGEEGRVLLRVQVSAEGSAVAIQVKQSSGFERLDAAARSAVEKWKFVPARQNGVATVSWVEVPLQFSLKK